MLLTKILIIILIPMASFADQVEDKKSVDQCFKRVRNILRFGIRLDDASVKIYRARNNRCLHKLMVYEGTYEYKNKILDEIEATVEKVNVSN